MDHIKMALSISVNSAAKGTSRMGVARHDKIRW